MASGNTRFTALNGLKVTSEIGVNTEIFTDLNVYGNLVANSLVTFTGNTSLANLNVASGTMFVNGGHVGINNTTPDATLHVQGTANVTGNVTITGSLLFVTGNFVVGGNLTYANVATSGLVANPDQAFLGNTTQRFDGFFYDVIIYDTLNPSVNSIALGNTTNRWQLFANQGNFSGAVSVGANTLYINAAAAQISVNANITTSDVLYVKGTSNLQGNVVANGSVVANSFQTNLVTFASNLVTVTTNGQSIIDKFPKTETQCVKYLIFAQASSNTLVEAIEVLLIHDGSASIIETTYGDIYNTKLGATSAAINGANVEVYFTTNSSISVTPVTPIAVTTQKTHF